MIRGIYLRNFRSYQELSLKSLGRSNIFIGRNGQGKTNLLEGIFFLSILRSFRTSQTGDLRKIGTSGFCLGAELVSEKNSVKFVEAEYFDRRKLRIDRNPVGKASDFIHNFRTAVFSPSDILIVTGGSSGRRRFLDMYISSVFPEYMPSLQEYVFALQNRNACLRLGRGKIAEAKAFEPILAEKGCAIVRFRQEIIRKLSEHVSELMKEISGLQKEFILKYPVQKGTSSAEEYMERFNNERDREFIRQYSTFGPHLDDFEFIYDGKTLRNFGSTGQCRLASLCLKLASVRIMRDSRLNDTGIVALVDDVTGELDMHTKKSFYNVLKGADQVFFTFTEKPVMDEFLDGAGIFEVSDGQVVKI